MKILLINELFTMGGSEIQTIREKEILRAHGHDVWHITFDRELNYEIDPKDHKHINVKPKETNGVIEKIKDKLYKWAIVDYEYQKQLISIIEKINPDIIHLNVNNYKQITLYDTLSKYTSIQTIRDFSAVCPSYLCVDLEYKTCQGFCYSNCLRKCIPNDSLRDKMRFILKRWNIQRVNKYHNKAICVNLCPSKCLSNVCTQNGLPTECLNNSFDFSILSGFEKSTDFEKKIYLVYGFVAEHKGIRQIIRAFNDFSQNKHVELHIIGKIQKEFENDFNKMVTENPKIKYLNRMEYKDIIKYLEKVYAVIVPSLWLENYPNTALEGLATRCLVLGANRGGIPELINDDRFAFNILNNEDIINKLENSYTLTECEYQKIVEANYQRVISNNNLEKYYERIMKVFSRTLFKGENE